MAKRKSLLERLVEKDPINKKTLEQLCKTSKKTESVMQSVKSGYSEISSGIQKMFAYGIVGTAVGIESVYMFFEHSYILGAVTAAMSMGTLAFGVRNGIRATKMAGTISSNALEYIEQNNYHVNAINYNQNAYEQLKARHNIDEICATKVISPTLSRNGKT